MIFGDCFKIILVRGVGKMFYNKEFKICYIKKCLRKSTWTFLSVNMVDSF